MRILGSLLLLGSIALVLDWPTARATRSASSAPLQPPVDARSLEQFIDRCQREHRPYKLSLAQLVEEFTAAARKPAGVPLSLRHLHGFTWFFGYVVDPEKNDVSLLGVVDPEAPTIDLDCLATALRAAYGGTTPFCSLDPDADTRFQKTVIDGVPWKCLWAQIMINADYDMKKISQGQFDPHIPGLESWVDLMVRRMTTERRSTFFELNRWWFSRPEREEPRTLLLDEEGEVVMLYRNPVVLRTEQRINGKFGSGTAAPEATRFAEQFTRSLPALAKKVPSIGKLLVLYRLLDLAVHLRQVGRVYPPYSEFWLKEYQSPYPGPDRQKKTLTRKINKRLGTSGLTVTIQGGVRMELILDPKAIRKEIDRDLARKLRK